MLNRIAIFVLIFLWSIPLFAQQNDTPSSANLVLKYLIEKYPTRFNKDTSEAIGWYKESFPSGITSYSLRLIDNSATGFRKIIRPIHDSVLQIIFPETKFYYFERKCHYEINNGILKSIAAIKANDTSTIQIFQPLPLGGIDSNWVSIFDRQITDQKAKELMCQSILKLFHSLNWVSINCRKEVLSSFNGKWTANTYQVTTVILSECDFDYTSKRKRYKPTTSYEDYEFNFYENRLIGIRVIKE